MYKTLSRHLQHGDGKQRSLSPETIDYEKRKNDKICTIGSAHKGKIIVGKVTKIVNYGAFVDINGVSGFVHISELSNKRVLDVNLELTIGRTYEFKILEIGLNKKGNISFKLTKKLDSCHKNDVVKKCTVEEISHAVEINKSSIKSASLVQNNGFTIGEILNKQSHQATIEILSNIDDKINSQPKIYDISGANTTSISYASQPSPIIDEYEDIKI